jgi:2'-5' RNA ligase
MHHVVYRYSSTQIDLPDDLAEEIVEWGRRYLPDDAIYTDPDDPSFGRENEIHATVLYGIHEDSPDKVAALLEEQKPFACALGRVNLFQTNPKFDVVKAEVRSRELHRLHNRLKESLEVTDKYPVYRPHVTIAYVQPGAANRLKGGGAFLGRSFEVREIIFSSHAGKKTKLRLKK